MIANAKVRAAARAIALRTVAHRIKLTADQILDLATSLPSDHEGGGGMESELFGFEDGVEGEEDDQVSKVSRDS
jgi:hypothetical protein